MSSYKKRRISQGEFSRRILELESIYGQKTLANRLGVSVSTIRRYRDGLTQPRNYDLYQKINTIYSRNKKLIEPEKVQRRVERIHKAKEVRTRRIWTITIEDYLNQSPFFRVYRDGVINIEKFLDLGEQGYMFGYYGSRNNVPMEGQLVIHGETPGERNGMIVKIIGIMVHGYDGRQETANIFVTITKHIYALGLTPRTLTSMTLESKHDLFRQTFFDTDFKSGMPGAYLGFYFKEGDEI